MRDDGRSDEDSKVKTAAEPSDAEREAQQRRGRERMLEMWRAAVAGITAAAQQAAAPANRPAQAEDEDPAGEVATWSFPPKVRAAG